MGLVSSFRLIHQPNATQEPICCVIFVRSLFGFLPSRLAASSRFPQVAETLGDKVRIVKVDTDAEPTLASQLQVSSRPCDCVVFQAVSLFLRTRRRPTS